MSFSVRPPGTGLVTSTSSASSRSVRSFANASSSVAMPLTATSALAIAMIRPGTRGVVGGWNRRSTPSGMTCIRAGSTPKSVAVSRFDASDGVRIRRAARATLPCMRRKPYQRRSVSLRHGVGASARSMRRSKVIGWCTEVMSGSPFRSMSSIPVPSTWLSWAMSKSPARSLSSLATRVANVLGSGKPPTHMVANSSTSTRSRNSRSFGTRNGSGSR